MQHHVYSMSNVLNQSGSGYNYIEGETCGYCHHNTFPLLSVSLLKTNASTASLIKDDVYVLELYRIYRLPACAFDTS